MQTTKLIYLAMWLLLVVPLIGFNIKRMSIKPFGDKRRVKWAITLFVAFVAIFISAFLFFAYKVTIETRYELAAERYIDLHAEYVTGQLTYDEYINATAPMRTKDADTSDLKNQLDSSGLSVSKVRFQIGSWITPKYYGTYSSFPKVESLGDENPVFLLYRFDDESAEFSYYLIEMVWNDAEGWKIAYHARATDAQYKEGKSVLPTELNGKWYNISA